MNIDDTRWWPFVINFFLGWMECFGMGGRAGIYG